MFGYTYPDVDGGQTVDAIKKRYDEKYGWAGQKRRNLPKSMEPLPIFEKAQVFRYDPATKALLIAESEKTGALDAVLNKSLEKEIVQITCNQPVFTQQTVLGRSVELKEPILENRILPKLAHSDFVVSDAYDVKEEKVERTWYIDNIVKR